jgi:ring-1,2-phenylacetyl-CoA epoxidase subunit PaaE
MLESTWRGLRRDLRFFLGGLVGDPPPPFMARQRAHRPLEGREVHIAAIERPALDSVTLQLVDASGAPIPFRAGQFFTLLVEVDGQLVRRAYSASSAPGTGSGVDLTVRRVPGGLVSNRLVDAAEPGQALRLLGPSGSFVPPEGIDELVLVAGGSGITPIVSIVRDRLARDSDRTRICVLYGHRKAELAAFATELVALAAAHPARLDLQLVFEEPGGGFEHAVGRLDRATVRASLDDAGLLAPVEGSKRVYMLCGPLGMMNEARAALAEAGVDPASVLEERFASPPVAAREVDASEEPQPLVVRRAGRSRALVVAPGQTLLEAATASGVDMPYSCTMGGCGACRVKLVEGQVTVSEPSCLSEAERASGRILACVARPLGPARWRSRPRDGPPPEPRTARCIRGPRRERCRAALQDEGSLCAHRSRAADDPLLHPRGPRPGRQEDGRNQAEYGREHLERLRFVKRLQEERMLPLRAIRAVLDGQDASFTPRSRTCCST